jgi:integrase/recombinase XerD
MSRELNEFEKFLLVRKGIGMVTLKGYNDSVRRLTRALKTQEPSHEQITNYIVAMHEKRYSYSHIVNTSLAIEWYMQFTGNPIKLGRPKKPKHIIKDTLTEAEITMLISVAKNTRERAIITLLAYSGIRNKELCELRVCDVNLGENMLRVLEGKGKKDRLINISGECSRIVINYLNEYQRRPDDYLFTTLRENKRYGTSDLRKLVNVLKNRAKINKRIYPHLLRHSLATNLLKRGANIYLIKEQLGHAFIETTEVYLRSFPIDIKHQYQMYVPSYV